MATGRSIAEAALREPLRGVGWQPRAAGWYTKELVPGFIGVVALAAASEHAVPGHAEVMLHVGLRDDAAEKIVAQLTGQPDGNYRQRTCTTPIGSVTPGNRWRDWEISEATASAVATDLAAAVKLHAEPYLVRLARERGELIEATRTSATSIQASGIARLAVLLARAGSRAEARSFLVERLNEMGDRQDAAAQLERDIAARVSEWLDSTSQPPR